ncbi:Pectin degradation repressor protein KdgR [Pirellulimonas nuda]|uniref:Pectin degradation repressor protein KdgR n=1 Tax=Pirellulimonas nuda TaxID=2528009 RepID=A0A518DAQ5_9BACT|nr:Pectin degradation repressor protein KdgR [Pirellulimonas nuda]
MAWRPVEEVSRLLAEIEFKAFTPHTTPGPRQLLSELRRVKAQGYAIDDQERELGVRCVTAPVRNASGAVVAALSVSAPASRLPKRLLPVRAREVIAAADVVSLRLGHAPSSD